MKQIIDEFFKGYAPLNNFNPKKIYASKGNNGFIYKLQFHPHATSDNKYIWIVMNNTSHYEKDEFKSMSDAVKKFINSNCKVYEFDDLEDFNNWIKYTV